MEEMFALQSSGTQMLIPIPPGKICIGCHQVYTIKFHYDGKIDCLKVRLVAKGYTQVYGSDYMEMFSPVAKLTSLAAFYSWSLHQIDIKNVFLHKDLNEEVYMDQPPGFVTQRDRGLICRLKKALYGLKQSPRVGFGRFSEVVIQFGLRKCGVDHLVFYYHFSANMIVLLVYVDEIVITGDIKDGIEKLKKFLKRKFHTKNLNPLKYILGIEIARSCSRVSISQQKYVFDLLLETGNVRN